MSDDHCAGPGERAAKLVHLRLFTSTVQGPSPRSTAPPIFWQPGPLHQGGGFAAPARFALSQNNDPVPTGASAGQFRFGLCLMRA